MTEPKRRYTKAGGMTASQPFTEFTNYWGAPDGELVSVKCASLVLGIRLQAVIKLGLPRHLVEKRAVYRKGDIQALLMADQAEPNALLRALQEDQRQVQAKQVARPSTRYQSVTGGLLPSEAKEAKQATKVNRKKPLTKDEVFCGWRSSLSLNKPVQPAMPMTEEYSRQVEESRPWLKEEMAAAEARELERKRALLEKDFDSELD